MPQSFIDSCREHKFLLPADGREWLPANHLAWFVIDAVADMDLSAFYSGYRAARRSDLKVAFVGSNRGGHPRRDCDAQATGQVGDRGLVVAVHEAWDPAATTR